jgi:hypothetical protein
MIVLRGTPHPTLPLKGGGRKKSIALSSPPPLRGRVREGGATPPP